MKMECHSNRLHSGIGQIYLCQSVSDESIKYKYLMGQIPSDMDRHQYIISLRLVFRLSKAILCQGQTSIHSTSDAALKWLIQRSSSTLQHYFDAEISPSKEKKEAKKRNFGFSVEAIPCVLDANMNNR